MNCHLEQVLVVASPQHRCCQQNVVAVGLAALEEPVAVQLVVVAVE